MIKDLVYDGSLFYYRDDLHLRLALRTKQGICFIDKLNQGGPGGFAILDPITFGIFITRIVGGSLIGRLRALPRFSPADI